MQTRFDDIADKEIAVAIKEVTFKIVPDRKSFCSEVFKIAELCRDMHYWKCWLGPPVTFFDESGLNYDGHHRVRACKYIARELGFQIHIPVRYDPAMREAKTSHEKEYRAPCSLDCQCSNASGVSESLCK